MLRIFIISLEQSALPSGPLESYPWVGLFSDRLSILASTVVFLLLPPGAALWLLWKFKDGTSPETLTAVAVTISLIVVSWLTRGALAELRPRFATAALSLKPDDSA